MSWNIEGFYKNVEHAMSAVERNTQLPPTIKAYIKTGLAGITSTESPIFIKGFGHLCYTGSGGGNYEVTSAQLEVKPVVFAPEVFAT